jgi:DNA-binding NarL/FixJ family response regulator
MDEKTTVLLVDDHVLVRHGFRRFLEDEADITVVAKQAMALRLSKWLAI